MRIDRCALYVLIEGIVLMARLNITLPDVLYARLEQLRDRINLSKVCATALEKEVTMLEGQPPITDPRIARLLQRLQSARERWHQRGYEDGIGWAVDLATRDALQSVAIHFAELDGRQLAEVFQMRGEVGITTQLAPPPSPSPTLHVQPPMSAGPGVSGGVLPLLRKGPAPPATPAGSPAGLFHHHPVVVPLSRFPRSLAPAA